jgi:phosphoenolpyruvate carboxylase
MIWLVQTIYSSQLDSIPRSIYYLNPYFAALPIINIDTTKNNTCNDDFQKVVLKTFPTIKEEMITKSNMTHWDINPVVICVQYGK